MGQVRSINQKDFSSGINAVSSIYDIGEKQVARATNLLLDEHGALRTRDGYTVLATAPPAQQIQPISYVGQLNKNDGSSIPFAILHGTPNPTNLWITSSNPWTAMPGTPLPDIKLPQSVTMTNVEVIVGDYFVPFTTDGATNTQITAVAGQTVPPGAIHVAFHLGSLWVWNTSAANTTLDGPSSLRMSDANNFNSWPNANQTFISKDDGQVGMGLAEFTLAETGISPTQTLIAFKNFSGYQITGVFGSQNFSVQRIKSDMGCTASRSIQFVSGFGVIRLTHKGFALFNGVDDKLISEEIRPYLFGKDDIAPLNFNAINTSWAVQSQNPPLYVCACPTGSAGLDRVFIYDLVRKAWTIMTVPQTQLSTLNLIYSQSVSPLVKAGTQNNTGQILNLFNGATTDAGVGIPWTFRTRAFFNGSNLNHTYWRRLGIGAAFIPPSIPITVQATFPNSSLLVPLAGTVTLTTGATNALWGSINWGQFTWGSSTGGFFESEPAWFALKRTEPSVFFDISGNGPVRIRGIDVDNVQKPAGRRP